MKVVMGNTFSPPMFTTTRAVASKFSRTEIYEKLLRGIMFALVKHPMWKSYFEYDNKKADPYNACVLNTLALGSFDHYVDVINTELDNFWRGEKQRVCQHLKTYLTHREDPNMTYKGKSRVLIRVTDVGPKEFNLKDGDKLFCDALNIIVKLVWTTFAKAPARYDNGALVEPAEVEKSNKLLRYMEFTFPIFKMGPNPLCLPPSHLDCVEGNFCLTARQLKIPIIRGNRNVDAAVTQCLAESALDDVVERDPMLVRARAEAHEASNIDFGADDINEFLIDDENFDTSDESEDNMDVPQEPDPQNQPPPQPPAPNVGIFDNIRPDMDRVNPFIAAPAPVPGPPPMEMHAFPLSGMSTAHTNNLGIGGDYLLPNRASLGSFKQMFEEGRQDAGDVLGQERDQTQPKRNKSKKSKEEREREKAAAKAAKNKESKKRKKAAKRKVEEGKEGHEDSG